MRLWSLWFSWSVVVRVSERSRWLGACAPSLVNRAITVRRSVSKKGVLKVPKNGKARGAALSPQLAERLKMFVEGRNVDEPLFLSKEGKRMEPDNLVKRHLKPILKKLGLKGAAHAFRRETPAYWIPCVLR